MHQFREPEIQASSEYLREQERSAATAQKYLRHFEQFYLWLPEGKLVDKAAVIAYKDLLAQSRAPGGVNTVLAALNGVFRFQGWQDCIAKSLRIQRQVFSSPESELTREEYLRLVETARLKSNKRLALLLQLTAPTGIQVSEIRYVTVEALARKRVQIQLKGKIRTILLPGKLCHKLRKYQRRQKLLSGPIFLTQTGRHIDRRKIWAQMKCLCAGIP